MTMKRYQPSTKTPRTLFGFAAVAMSALTIGLMVGAPAQLATANRTMLASAAVTPAAATEVAIYPARIDVVASRTILVGSAHVSEATPRAGQQG
jgi:hypothetical protein